MIDPTLSFNAIVGYRFGDAASRLLRRTQVRLGIINLNDEQPPLASSSGFGYDASVNQNLLAGRTGTLELTPDPRPHHGPRCAGAVRPAPAEVRRGA